MKRSEATKQAAIDAVHAGTPVSRVAKTYHVSQSCVRLWVKAAMDQAPEPASVTPTYEALAPALDLIRVRDAITTLTNAGLI